MNSEDFTPEHSRRIARWLIPTLLSLNKLRDRMKANRFPQDDELYRAAVNAHESVRILRAKMHTMEVYRDPENAIRLWNRKGRTATGPLGGYPIAYASVAQPGAVDKLQPCPMPPIQSPAES